VYQKLGMFGMPRSPNFSPQPPEYDEYQFTGDQVRGFGILHDGAFDTPFHFFGAVGFDQNPTNPLGFPTGTAGDLMRRRVESFVLAFPTNLAPIVGQQVTLPPTNRSAFVPRVNLLVSRANAGECELVAKSHWLGRERGFYHIGGGQFLSDISAIPPLPRVTLETLAALLGRELTYTCAPPGSGMRIGVDRDGDTYRDGDEILAGSDPADPNSVP